MATATKQMLAEAASDAPEPRRALEYRARKDFTFNGAEIKRGEMVAIADVRKARGMITARLVADPLEVA